jgi:hypothetical protein
MRSDHAGSTDRSFRLVEHSERQLVAFAVDTTRSRATGAAPTAAASAQNSAARSSSA